MGFIQNQNMTWDFYSKDVTNGESPPLPPSTVNTTIIVLGVLTFVLQLCLFLLFMLRCWRVDNNVKKALKQSDSVTKLSELPYMYPGIDTQLTYFFCHDAAGVLSPSTSTSNAEDKYEPSLSSLCAPPIHWDLVQS